MDLASFIGRVQEISGVTNGSPKPKAQDARYPAWRLLRALEGIRELGPDDAVLIRQWIRSSSNRVRDLQVPIAAKDLLARAGVVVRGEDLTADPFAPSWGAAKGAFPIDERSELARLNESIPAEPFLRRLGFDSWNSAAQKEAAWLVANARPGSSNLVALPTGAGKSLCFELLPLNDASLTVVVVPTVALAIDQQRAAQDLYSKCPDVAPMLFTANSGADVLNAIKERRTRLLFSSPESIVRGRLTGPLNEAAKSRYLRNLVIDEAHIVEQWGIYFRPEFQLLSGLRRGWLAATDGLLRTYLFSATFTREARDNLKRMYSSEPENQWAEYVSQRLRPEVRYFDYNFADSDRRESALRESIWHLPRPLVVYVTAVEHAKATYELLRSEGFRRVAVFTGESEDDERSDILKRWRTDDLDIVVATSAFGMGVDKPDVRAVVHACIPEDLHRFYQEVGRGGRDGWSSISLLLTTESDRRIARANQPKLLTEHLSKGRWADLWETAQPIDADAFRYRIRLDVRPKRLVGGFDSDENVRWNKRLLLQLVRADCLLLEDIVTERNEVGNWIDWVHVRLQVPPESPRISAAVEASRDSELGRVRAGFAQVGEYQTANKCLGRAFRRAYGEDTAYFCGGCRFCRTEGRRTGGVPDLPLPLFQHGQVGPACVISSSPDPLLQTDRSALISLLNQLVVDRAVKRFFCAKDDLPMWQGVFAEIPNPFSGFVFRIDTLDGRHPETFPPHEGETVCLYGTKLTAELLRFRSGTLTVHLVPNRLWRPDSEGRRPLESVGAIHYLSPAAWLRTSTDVY